MVSTQGIPIALIVDCCYSQNKVQNGDLPVQEDFLWWVWKSGEEGLKQLVCSLAVDAEELNYSELLLSNDEASVSEPTLHVEPTKCKF